LKLKTHYYYHPSPPAPFSYQTRTVIQDLLCAFDPFNVALGHGPLALCNKVKVAFNAALAGTGTGAMHVLLFNNSHRLSDLPNKAGSVPTSG
jgi:hypothetical protein